MPNPEGLDDDVVHVTVTDVDDEHPMLAELEIPKKEDNE
jgi:hypothetical protein